MPEDEIIREPEDTSHVFPVEDLHTQPEESKPPPPLEAMPPSEPDGNPSIALQLRRAIELLARAVPLTEKEMLEIPDLYEQWKPGVEYEQGRVLKYRDEVFEVTDIYSVSQAHTSAENLTPDDTPTLYRLIVAT